MVAYCIGNVGAKWRFCGTLEMWCQKILEDFLTHLRNCGSLRDVVERSSLKTYRTAEPPVADSNPASLTKIPGRGRFITVIL